MLAIRLQRLGRKGYPTYRLAVQEAQRHPQSGKIVSYVGHYNPHSKEVKLDVEKVEFYLKNGAQPTPRVVKLLKAEKVKLPKWVAEIDSKKQTNIKNLEKLRKNRSAGTKPAAEKPEQDEAEIVADKATPADAPGAEEAALPQESADNTAESKAETEPAAEVKAEQPAKVESEAESPEA